MLFEHQQDNNWNKLKVNFTDENVDSDGNLSFENEGYKLYCTNKDVNYIIYDSNYKKAIISNVTVGMSFENIEKNLGTPTFKDLGYISSIEKRNITGFWNSIKTDKNMNINNTFSIVGTIFKSFTSCFISSIVSIVSRYSLVNNLLEPSK